MMSNSALRTTTPRRMPLRPRDLPRAEGVVEFGYGDSKIDKLRSHIPKVAATCQS